MEEESANEFATAMVASGLMDETEFVKWKVQTECSIEFSDIMKLRDNDIYEVETWKSDLEKQIQRVF